MSIRLSVEASDSEVENLLAYPMGRPLHLDDKLDLLERTAIWLKAGREHSYRVSPAESSVLLSFDSVPVQRGNAGTHSPQCSEQLISQEGRK